MKDTLDEDISRCFDEAYKFMIDNKNVNILVHCKKGVSRSPTIVAYYLMKLIHDYTRKDSYVVRKQRTHSDEILPEVLELMCSYRPCVNPNTNFINQLKKHEHSMIYEHSKQKRIC